MKRKRSRRRRHDHLQEYRDVVLQPEWYQRLYQNMLRQDPARARELWRLLRREPPGRYARRLQLWLLVLIPLGMVVGFLLYAMTIHR